MSKKFFCELGDASDAPHLGEVANNDLFGGREVVDFVVFGSDTKAN